MNIGEQIRTYRKENNLTQEQIATALGVTTPAVNKWERGVSLPDIMLLPALARLLEIDMNTLFSFHEALTEQEVTSFVNTLYARAMAGEIADAFAEAQKKLRDYPHDVPLLYTCATMLSAALTLHPDEAAAHSAWRAAITDWLTRASEEGDDTFRTAARYQLATQAIQEGRYDEAECLVEQLPNGTFDKNMLWLSLLSQQGRYEEASLLAESQVLAKVVLLHSHLLQLIEYDVKSDRPADAQAVADLASTLAECFGLWPHESESSQLVLALHKQDRDAALAHIRHIFDILGETWDGSTCAHFRHLAEAGKLPDAGPSVRTVFLRELQTQPEYDFLRESDEFQALLAKARNTLA